MYRTKSLLWLVVFLGWVTSAHAAPFAYITNSDIHNVSVIDTANNMVVATVGVGINPNGVAVHPTGAFAYINNNGSGTVSVIRASDNTVIANILIGGFPAGVAVHPAGTFAYASNGRGNTVSVINTTTNTVTAIIPMGFLNGRALSPGGVVVHPNGTRVYVTSSDPDDNVTNSFVNVIDTTTNPNTVIVRVPVDPGPTGIAIHPAGTFVYATSRINNTVSVVNTATNTMVDSIPVGMFPLGVTVHPAGSFVYVTNQHANPDNVSPDTVSVIRTSDNTVVATVQVGVDPEGIAAHPDGTRVYVANNNGFNVSVISTITNTVIATIPVAGRPVAVGQFIGPLVSDIPHITSISPPSGPVGTLVTITGTNFGTAQGTSTVTFDSTVASISSWSDTQIQLVVPSLQPGIYDVVVTTSAGSSNQVNFGVTCDFSIDLFANNTGAGGLAEAIISNQRISSGSVTGSVRIENSMRFWLGILATETIPVESGELVFDDTAGIAGEAAAFGIIPPCRSGFSIRPPFIQCVNPGQAAWVLSFCSPGVISIDLGFTSLSASFTLLDLLVGSVVPGLSYSLLVNLIAEFDEVPKFAEARDCLARVGSQGGGVRCTARALFELTTDSTQRNQILGILTRFGINWDARELFRRLLGVPIGLLQLVGDELVFLIQTNGTGVLTIELEGN